MPCSFGACPTLTIRALEMDCVTISFLPKHPTPPPPYLWSKGRLSSSLSPPLRPFQGSCKFCFGLVGGNDTGTQVLACVQPDESTDQRQLPHTPPLYLVNVSFIPPIFFSINIRIWLGLFISMVHANVSIEFSRHVRSGINIGFLSILKLDICVMF